MLQTELWSAGRSLVCLSLILRLLKIPHDLPPSLHPIFLITKHTASFTFVQNILLKHSFITIAPIFLNPTFNPLNNQIFSRVLLPEWKLDVLIHLFQRYGMNPIRH